jgi:hypothetical protein
MLQIADCHLVTLSRLTYHLTEFCILHFALITLSPSLK